MSRRYTRYSWSYPNRTLCDVFEEMRKCFKNYNFASLGSLIEEAQVLANRMESALNDVHDVEDMHEERHKAKEEMKKLYKELDELEKKVKEKKGDNE